MYPECVAFLRKTMRVREIVILVHLSHSHGFSQKRNAFRIHRTAPYSFLLQPLNEDEKNKMSAESKLSPDGETVGRRSQ